MRDITLYSEEGRMKTTTGRVALILLLGVIISACGGGGGDDGGSSSSAPQSIAGIWSGTFTSSILHTAYGVGGLITESGTARFANTSLLSQYGGQVTVNGGSFTSAATAYAPYGGTLPDGSTAGAVSISGTFTEKGVMSGRYSGVGDNGTFYLTYSSSYDRPSSLSAIAGTWTGSVAGYANTLMIDSGGNIIGSSNSGCTYSGNVGIIDSAHNLYSLTLTIGNCGGGDGIYSGLAALTDKNAANDSFLISVSSNSYSYVSTMMRQ
jgi:hypothetical protein